MDADGTKDGYDLRADRAGARGGRRAGDRQRRRGQAGDFAPAVHAGADAVLAASVFHFGELTVGEVKDSLRADGITVR